MFTSMIQSVSEVEQTLATNTSPINFVTDDIRSRNASCYGWLNRTENTPNYTLLAGGIYEVNFNANITSATAGVVGLALFSEGNIQIPGTEIDIAVATADEYENGGFSKTLRICPRETITLTVNSVPTIGTTATQIPKVKNANITIKRLNNN